MRPLSHPMPEIPPTQLVDRSPHSAYEPKSRLRLNPTNAVGGSFISSLHDRRRLLPNPTNGVGGLFISNLPECGPECVTPRVVRLGMNDPPTALVGFPFKASPLAALRRPVRGTNA
jgi:hypothetical protein